MADERCGTCRFGPVACPGGRHGDCRRYPPKAGAMREWPEVHTDDWCGEWKPLPDAPMPRTGRIVSPAPTRKLTVEPANGRR